jgi:hypothetical protein
MDAKAVAQRWADTWSRAWPQRDAEAITALYADTALYRSPADEMVDRGLRRPLPDNTAGIATLLYAREPPREVGLTRRDRHYGGPPVSNQICARICARDAAGWGATRETRRSGIDALCPLSEVSAATRDYARRQRQKSYGS